MRYYPYTRRWRYRNNRWNRNRRYFRRYYWWRNPYYGGIGFCPYPYINCIVPAVMGAVVASRVINAPFCHFRRWR